MQLARFLASAALCVVAAATQAQDVKLGTLNIGKPFARATVPGQTAGGGYLSIDNKGGDDRLLSASAAVARSVELHSMTMDGNVMRMRQLDAIALPAGKKTELKPGGLHIMFIGLKAPLGEGDTFPMTLRFEKAGEVTLTVNVEAAAGGSGHGSGHKH
jgi:copper(I)-binding protein